jgi:ferredoxin
MTGKIRGLLMEGINLQDGLLGDCIDALRAALPYVVECDEGGGPSTCKYCQKALPDGVTVCSTCAVGLVADVLAALPEIAARKYDVSQPKEDNQ